MLFNQVRSINNFAVVAGNGFHSNELFFHSFGEAPMESIIIIYCCRFVPEDKFIK